MRDASPSPLSAAVNRLWLPRYSLSQCMRTVVSRNTLGVALTPSQRYNHFAAAPLCSLNWWFVGRSEMLPTGGPPDPDSPRVALPGRVVFGGPQTRPSTSWNTGPVHAMTLLLQPDALQRLIGVDPVRWVNQLVDAAEVLPPAWLSMCRAVLNDPDDDARVCRIQDFLDPLWQAARPAESWQARRYRDWSHALALRAATSAPGRSLRQVERRIKHWSGLPMRELRGLARAEDMFFHALAQNNAGGSVKWADVAADCGYADQSHLCRETRRLTGFSPEALRHGIACDEAFWTYRLWI